MLAVAGKKICFVRFGGGLSLSFFVLLLQFSKVSLSPQASFFQFFRGSKSSDFSAKHDMASLGINTFRQECCRLIPFTTTEHADQFIMLNPFNWGLAYVICYAKCPASPDFSSYVYEGENPTIQNLSVRNQSFMSLLNELMADDQNWLMTRIYFTIDEKTI